MNNRIGKRTWQFSTPAIIASYATTAGIKENEGPLGSHFDFIFPDNLFDEASWEKAEQKLQQYALEIALEKRGVESDTIDCLLGGDLLNQIVATNFTARWAGTPYLGLYGACSTLAEGLLLAGTLLSGGFVQRAAVCTSSHHDTAERQLRFPTEMGVQRAMTAQWTVTGGGAYLLEKGQGNIGVTCGVCGKIIDNGTKNNMDMGTAMASAAVDTICAYLNDCHDLASLDYIVTGDLGHIGWEICQKMLLQRGYDVKNKLLDCGMLIYDKKQDTHAGGSGCGCSATVLGAHFLPQLTEGKLKKILLVGTGALLSPTSTQQGESIPCIAHGVVIEQLH